MPKYLIVETQKLLDSKRNPKSKKIVELLNKKYNLSYIQDAHIAGNYLVYVLTDTPISNEIAHDLYMCDFLDTDTGKPNVEKPVGFEQIELDELIDYLLSM